jgi:hypothetical protein
MSEEEETYNKDDVVALLLDRQQVEAQKHCKKTM